MAYHPKTIDFILCSNCTWNILQDRLYPRPQIKPWWFFFLIQSFQASFLITSLWLQQDQKKKKKKQKKKPTTIKNKYMKAKQYDSKQPTGHWRKEKGNQNMPRNNDNENTTQNLWYSVKAVLRRKFIAIQAYLKKQERHQINNLSFNLKQQKKNKRIQG